MAIDGVIRGDVLVIHAREERIDAAGALAFKERMREIIATPSRKVILDLSPVQFLDSSGLGAVVAMMKLLAPERPLELAALTPAVARVFRLTRMDTVFRIHGEVAEGLDGDIG